MAKPKTKSVKRERSLSDILENAEYRYQIAYNRFVSNDDPDLWTEMLHWRETVKWLKEMKKAA